MHVFEWDKSVFLPSFSFRYCRYIVPHGSLLTHQDSIFRRSLEYGLKKCCPESKSASSSQFQSETTNHHHHYLTNVKNKKNSPCGSSSAARGHIPCSPQMIDAQTLPQCRHPHYYPQHLRFHLRHSQYRTTPYVPAAQRRSPTARSHRPR